MQLVYIRLGVYLKHGLYFTHITYFQNIEPGTNYDTKNKTGDIEKLTYSYDEQSDLNETNMISELTTDNREFFFKKKTWIYNWILSLQVILWIS